MPVQLRYEDNQEALTNLTVMKIPSNKGDITGYGSQEEFLNQLQTMGLFGKQAYTGAFFDFRLGFKVVAGPHRHAPARCNCKRRW